jgi:hypothetical protein
MGSGVVIEAPKLLTLKGRATTVKTGNMYGVVGVLSPVALQLAEEQDLDADLCVLLTSSNHIWDRSFTGLLKPHFTSPLHARGDSVIYN